MLYSGMPTRTIAFMNQKGGVGKTTSAVNIAAGIAARGRRVLLIDMDPQAHATLHLGHEVKEGEPSVYDLLLDTPPSGIPLHTIAKETRPNLVLIPAVTDLAAIETELASFEDRLTRLASALDQWRGRFDFVFFDCPPSLGVLTLNAMAAAREVIIPMQAHYLALQGVGKLIETVTLIRGAFNPSLSVTGVILCAHDNTTTHAREVVADLESFLAAAAGSAEDLPHKHARIFRPHVRRNIKLAEAPSYGKTIYEYAPLCAGAEDYARLAETLVAELDAARTRPESPVVVPRATPTHA